MNEAALRSDRQESPPAAASSSAQALGLADWSFRSKLVAVVCLLVLLTGGTITTLAYRSAQTSTQLLADRLFREVSEHAVTHTRSFVLRAAPIAESLAQLADHGLALDDSDRLAAQLLAVLEANPGLSWVSYGDEQGTFTGAYRTDGGKLRINQSRIVDGKTRLVERDVRTDGTWQAFREDADSGYDPRQRPFYVKAKEQGRLVWLPPYVFFNQGIPGISCAAPVRNAQAQLRGVVSIDFDLHALSEFVSHLSVSEHSTVFLFTADQTLLAHPSQRVVSSSGAAELPRLMTLADTGDPLVEAFRRELRAEHVQAPPGESFHFFNLRHDGQTYLASTTAFRVGDDLVWVVGAAAPKSDFLGDVWRSQMLALAAATASMLLALLAAVWLAQRVSQPVQSLIGFMQRVGGGDLEARADFGGSREFRQLSQALNRMIEELRDRLRLRHSLNVAMEVQQRLLPARPPQVPGLEVAGHSTYCDETGGDYYDFLALEEADSGQLLVALGDVMGHGVAAALVMAGVRAVLRDRAATSGSLAELMSRLNRMIAADLEGSRFMTMHLSVIDPHAKTFRFVSAGHDPAMLYDPATDKLEEIDIAGLPLGIMDTIEYSEHTHGGLRPGQVIVIGTDGVWEMQNAAGGQFGKDRLRELIRQHGSRPAEEILEAIRQELFAFRGDCEAIDDVTFLVVKLGAETAT